MIIWAITIMLFALGGFGLFLSQKKSLLLSVGILFLIELVWAIVSCVYLDYGNAYMYEVGKTSYHTGALLRMMLMYLPLIFVFVVSTNDVKYKTYQIKLSFVKINYVQLVRLALLFTLFIILYCFLDMVISGIPLFSPHISRINFAKYSKLPLSMKVNGEVTFWGVFVAGIAFFTDENKTNKKLALFVFCFTVLHRFLMEYKYHGMYNVIFAFFVPGLLQWYRKVNYHVVSFKTLFKAIAIFCAILVSSYMLYTILHTNKNPLQLLIDRLFALQSQVFWSLDEMLFVKLGEYSGNKQDLLQEIRAVFHNLGQQDVNSGIINIMKKIGHPTVVANTLANGVRWAGNYLAVGINTVGYAGTAVISLALGCIISFDLKMLCASIDNKEFVVLYFAQSLLWDLLDYFRIGNWCIIINIKTICTLLCLFMFYLLKNRYSTRWRKYGHN